MIPAIDTKSSKPSYKVCYQENGKELCLDTSKILQDEFVKNLSEEDRAFIEKFFSYFPKADKNNDKIIEKKEFMDVIHMYVKSFYPSENIIYNGPFSEEKSIKTYFHYLLEIFNKYGVRNFVV